MQIILLRSLLTVENILKSILHYLINHFNNLSAVLIKLFQFHFFIIDGTAIDHACHHSQTPVMMTLGIFKQSLRNKSVAWRNVGFVKNNVKEQYSQQQINDATRQLRKYPRNHECYVPDNHNDWNTQIRCIMNDLLRIQKKKKGIKWCFTIDGMKQTIEYRLIFRVLFFAGDTMEHNKMCSLRGGNMGKFPCCMCSITQNHLDNPTMFPYPN